MNNPFYEGQEVVCISEYLPLVKKYSSPDTIDDSPKPKKGEKLVIDDILGDYLMFNKFNRENETNWFHHTRFAPIQEIGVFADEILENIKSEISSI